MTWRQGDTCPSFASARGETLLRLAPNALLGRYHPDALLDLSVICKQMGRSPDWMPDILLRADGYETDFYKKD